MLFVHLVAIAVLQGITEFLPISSSGHLILLPLLSGWPDHGLMYDIAAHFGTLLAVVCYFRADLRQMASHWIASLSGGRSNEHSRLAWAVLCATIPVSVAGLVTHDFIAENFRSPLLIAATTIGFAIVLWFADRFGKRTRATQALTWTDIACVGFAQALALVPGTSRSGITISAALALGFTREAAARFSFLLSIPVIVLATSYESLQLIGRQGAIDWLGLSVVTIGSALSAFVCIAVFLRVLDRVGMLPFVIYRFALGGVLIWLFI
ncbi:MAG: undecaprenyl-diphosphate phosphatase [Proteobacteria bacterium]|nr:undecaprenyl-diphosphate phosphatase [Pseudomonadota bacterium]